MVNTYPTNILSVVLHQRSDFTIWLTATMEPPITKSTIKEFILFSLHELTAHASFETDMRKKGNCIILDKVV